MVKDTSEFDRLLGNPLSLLGPEQEPRGKNLVELHYYMYLTTNNILLAELDISVVAYSDRDETLHVRDNMVSIAVIILRV
jgi:hypothetical protein